MQTMLVARLDLGSVNFTELTASAPVLLPKADCAIVDAQWLLGVCMGSVDPQDFPSDPESECSEPMSAPTSMMSSQGAADVLIGPVCHEPHCYSKGPNAAAIYHGLRAV